MKRVITAIGNQNLNERLKEKYEVVTKDILYKEGIIEALNQDSNIDILIISELLGGEIEFKELINVVLQRNDKIEIVVFLESENTELRSFLYNKGIHKIYINNEVDIDTFIINLQDSVEDKTQELNEEIRKLKKIIENGKMIESKTANKTSKVIAITGNYGTGKSIISCILCKEFARQKKKTLLIDFDIYNNSIKTLFNISNDIETTDIERNIIKISEYEHVLCNINNIYDDETKMIYINLEKLINELRNNYDDIIIDTTSNYKDKYIKQILNLSDDVYFIITPTINDIKKALKLYEVYVVDFGIGEKIRLVINKENNYSIDSYIISKMFNGKEISGTLKYNEKIEIDINNKIKNKNLMKINSLI